MLELPEVLSRAAEIQEHVVGKTVSCVLPPSKVHKFCWYSGDPVQYQTVLSGKKIVGAEGFGIFVELSFEGGYKLCVNDGVNIRLMPVEQVPKNYQLMMKLTDKMAIVFTVAMYGGIFLHDGIYDNEYYLKSRRTVSPFMQGFEEYFHRQRKESKQRLSAKAFLATEQRFPGIGNGVLQDILFEAGIHPKRKIETLTEAEWKKLFQCTVSVLQEMAEKGGRDTEKNLFGNSGEYRMKMSKNALAGGCPVCSGTIIKETYMGGSVYYCPVCQPKE